MLTGVAVTVLLAATASGLAPAAPRRPNLEELGFPPRAPFDHTTGAFTVQLTELPDDARPRALLERLRPAAKDGPAAVDLQHETFFVYVPAEYDPATPYGLWVWVSPNDFGGLLRDDLRQLLAREKLIWIGAHRAGNDREGLDRLALALTAAELAPRHWSVDPQRVYVSGRSGGGRLASELAFLWPETFRGGIFVVGCNWYAPLPVPGQAGQIWAASFAEPPRKSARLLHDERRFAFLTGEKDFNRDEMRTTERAAAAAGFRHTRLIEVPGADHFTPMAVEYWQQAIEFLDGGGRRAGG